MSQVFNIIHQERMWLQPNEVSEDQISDTHIRRHNFAIDKGKIINTIKDHNNIKGFTVESKVPVKNLPLTKFAKINL